MGESVERKARVVGYLRVSTSKQDVDGQRLQILEAANAAGMSVSDFQAVEVSSRKSIEDRGITVLLGGVERGDMIIVAELSRLGRSLVQVVCIVDQLLKAGVRLWAIKENIRLDGSGEMDIATKTTVTLFGLMAEIERDLISQRTKAGLAAARARGTVLGAPKGRRWSKLDEHNDKIREYIGLKVPVSKMAEIYGVSKSSMMGHIKSRGLREGGEHGEG